MNEKRKYRRVILSLPAVCQVIGAAQLPVPVEVVDVGAEGLRFVGEGTFYPGQELSLEVALSPARKVVVRTQVIWQANVFGTEQVQVGLRIVDLSKDDEAAWAHFYCGKIFTVSEKKKILVIEDEVDAARLLTLELESAGYEVLWAADGESGYARYLETHPDLVLLDVMLPKLNGYEVCRRIRWQSGDEQTPVVMLTAKGEDADRIQGRIIGATVYMTKPFDAEKLLECLRGLL